MARSCLGGRGSGSRGGHEGRHGNPAPCRAQIRSPRPGAGPTPIPGEIILQPSPNPSPTARFPGEGSEREAGDVPWRCCGRGAEGLARGAREGRAPRDGGGGGAQGPEGSVCERARRGRRGRRALCGRPTCAVLPASQERGTGPPCTGRGGGASHGAATSAGFWIDFALLVAPNVAFFVAPLATVPYAAAAGCLGFLALAALVAPAEALRGRKMTRERLALVSDTRRVPFLTNFRASMMVATCIGILAVDFPAFPRRYAKAETFGTGLMDVGVGSFVLSNALVGREGKGGVGRGLMARAARAFRQASPLVLLGAVRLLSTKGIDYQEHVSEYGVHWNFFFTLAAVNVLRGLLPGAWANTGDAGGVLAAPHFWAGLGVLFLHQAALSAGLSAYIQDDSNRTDLGLVSLNKEGIVSTPGYVGLALLSQALGEAAVMGWRPRGEARSERSLWVAWVARLATLSGLFWAALYALSKLVEPVSRRTCNAAYVVWVIAFNLSVLAAFAAVEVLGPLPPGHAAVPVYQSINRNALAVFLAANLLTGAVNIFTDTLSASDAQAQGTLHAYMAVVAGAAFAADRADLSLKYW